MILELMRTNGLVANSSSTCTVLKSVLYSPVAEIILHREQITNQSYVPDIKSKEGISNKAPLQHPQQNIKTPQVRTQIQHTQPGTQRLQGTSNTTYNTKHKRLHINQRDQWATGADLGRPSAKLIANGVVIRITCAQPSHSSGCTEVSKNT